ncbi:hypothetical protein MMC11_004220 [Xylographa trunciseda]|nr:hypothetical protein [Xylographa trunciseda]
MSSRWNPETPESFSGWEQSHNSSVPISWATLLAYGVLSVLFFYYILQSLDHNPLLSILERAWQSLVYLTPASLVIALDKGTRTTGESKLDSPESYSSSRTFAAKSETMRHILGLDGAGMLSTFQRGRSLSLMTNVFKAPPKGSLPGLGNWDNSCYQNSVIQSLAALPSLSYFLTQTTSANIEASGPSTVKALKGVIEDLNNPANAGQRLWTPAELKTMSSWQQQDAQEYYSKVLDQVDKEASRSVMRERMDMGLRKIESSKPALREPNNSVSPGYAQRRFDLLPEELAHRILSNPLEGLLAQRVGCLKCGFVEGLSLIPFNCLTVPLGKQWEYDLQSCLDEYTTLESISGVECSKCTLLRRKEQLERLLQTTQTSSEDIPKRPPISEALYLSANARLSAVCEALENEDFSETTLTKKCQIPVKGRIETTKSKQAVIARLPKALTVHVNRSVFNERTGALSKNQASVRFPKLLDLTPWCLGTSTSTLSDTEDTITETWNADPSSSMLSETVMDEAAPSSDGEKLFILRAVITHYGRHENGHYICYRKNPRDTSFDDDGNDGDSWWRLSDEEVSEVSEEIVLDQGGVFMLFYERIQSAQVGPAIQQENAESFNAMEVPIISSEPPEQAQSRNQGQHDLERLALEDPVIAGNEEGLLSPVTSNSPRPHPQPLSVLAAECILPTVTPVAGEVLLQEKKSNERFGETSPGNENTNSSEDIESEDRSARLDTTEKEDRRVPPPMRTAGVRNFDRTGNGMASVSSMVIAN